MNYIESELKPCPFCGGEARLHEFRDGMWEAWCPNCPVCGPAYADVRAAAAAWNSRAERTCRDFGGEEGTNGEGYDFACSSCGWCGDVPEPNYCPNCGARVMEQRTCHMRPTCDGGFGCDKCNTWFPTMETKPSFFPHCGAMVIGGSDGDR